MRRIWRGSGMSRGTLTCMTAPALCSVPACPTPALTGERRCFAHLEDPHAYRERAAHRLAIDGDLAYLDLSGVRLRDHALRERKMVGTRLVGAALERVVFERCHLSLVFLHDAVLSHCRFVGCRLSAVILAGSELSDCKFDDCDIQRCNFLAATISRTLFESCDLTSSRFIGGTFRQVIMDDCNLHHAHLELADVGDLATPGSNLAEAHRR